MIIRRRRARQLPPFGVFGLNLALQHITQAISEQQQLATLRSISKLSPIWLSFVVIKPFKLTTCDTGFPLTLRFPHCQHIRILLYRNFIFAMASAYPILVPDQTANVRCSYPGCSTLRSPFIASTLPGR